MKIRNWIWRHAFGIDLETEQVFRWWKYHQTRRVWPVTATPDTERHTDMIMDIRRSMSPVKFTEECLNA